LAYGLKFMSIFSKVFSSIVVGAVLGCVSVAQATPVSYVPSSTTYFGPVSSQISNSPYTRFANQDWSWRQAAYSGSFSSATLTIGGYDVDPGEIDNIYAFDSSSTGGVWVLLGRLTGANNTFSNTSFTLTSNLFDDIASGLLLKIDIDAGSAGWGVGLTNSVLNLTSTNSVPEPGSLALLGLGLAGLVVVRKRSRV
jgi:hypothetical protein